MYTIMVKQKKEVNEWQKEILDAIDFMATLFDFLLLYSNSHSHVPLHTSAEHTYGRSAGCHVSVHDWFSLF